MDFNRRRYFGVEEIDDYVSDDEKQSDLFEAEPSAEEAVSPEDNESLEAEGSETEDK